MTVNRGLERHPPRSNSTYTVNVPQRSGLSLRNDNLPGPPENAGVCPRALGTSQRAGRLGSAPRYGWLHRGTGTLRGQWVLLLVLTGCGGVSGPSEEWAGFTPPHQYRLWHEEVETCVGTKRPFDDIVWRKVYAETFFCGGNPQIAAGCYDSPNTIYIVEPLLYAEWLVKHELIHYVRRNGKHDALLDWCGGGG